MNIKKNIKSFINSGLVFLLLFLFISYTPVLANMIIRGQCFIDGSPAPDGLDIRFKINVSGVFRDYTVLNKNHQTRNGFYEGEALADITSTFEKDGFVDDDVIFVFVNGQLSKNSSIGASPLNFGFKNNTVQSTPNAYINNEEPEPASNFTARPIPEGRVILTWTASPSEDAAEYHIFWDNQTGSIDYTSPWVIVTSTETSYTSPKLSDGALYYFHIKTVDTLGKIENNRSNITSVFPDDNPPAAIITSPANLEEISADFSVIGTAADSFFKNYKIEYGRSISPIEWYETGPFNFVPANNTRLHYFDTRGIPDGIYTLKLTVSDYAGNISVTKRPFYLSKNPRSIISPKSFEIVSSTVNFIGTAQDPLFESFRLDFGRGEQPSGWSNIVTSQNQAADSLLGSWDTAGYDGLYSVRLVIKKTNGSEMLADTTIIYLENSPPPISILEPENFFLTNKPVQVIKGMCKSNAVLKVNGTTIEIPSNTNLFDHTLTLSEGLNQYLFTASDRSGNSNQTNFFLSLDTVAPLLDISAPIDNLTTSTPSAEVRGQCEPGASLSVNGIYITLDAAGNFNQKINLSGHQNNLEFTAIDKAGNIKRESRVVIFSVPYTDVLAPEISIISPGNNSLISNTKAEIKFALSDDLSGIDDTSIEFFLDDKAYGTYLNQETQYLSYITHTPSTILSQGEHKITLKVKDKSGNQSSFTSYFSIDSRPPECSVSLEMDNLDPGLMHVRIIPDEKLVSLPECRVWLTDTGQDIDTLQPYYMVELTKIDESADIMEHYYGTISPGSTINGKILARVICRDLAGITKESSASLASSWADPGITLFLNAPKTASILLPGENITLHQRITIDNLNITVKKDAAQKTDAMTKQGLLSAAQAVVINPENAIFPENSKLTINYNDLDNDDFLDISGEISVQRLSIYTYDTVSGTFKFIKSDLNRTDKSLEAPVFKGGTYFLLADIKAPEITVLTSPGEKATTNPKLVYTISDSGSGIDQTKLILQLNGISTPFSFDESSGRAAFFPSAPLSADTTYAVTFFATDNSGNTAFSVVNFTTSDVLKVESSIPYPNPVRGASVKIRYTLTRDADEVLIDIYDTTGDKIFDAAGDTYGGINEFEWNTLSIDGKSLPNDVYFYKITAFNDEYKDINTGKIMLLR